MVATCNVCLGATKATIWFKFPNTGWIVYKPSTFPFDYETVDGRITFWQRQSLPPRAFRPVFRFDRYRFPQGDYFATYEAVIANLSAYLYGDLATLEVDSNGYYGVRGRDQCNNSIFYHLKEASGTYGLLKLCNFPSGGCVTSGNYSLIRKDYHPSLVANCPGCPDPWDIKIFEMMGLGIPQVQITCNADKCPPDTACECTRNTITCCYDSNGNPIYSFKN